ncbi:MAG TPA: autotransporter-associated beta strand repeat-containing protein [Rariglobus sp.]
MNKAATPTPRSSVVKHSLSGAVSLFVLASVLQSKAADLIKADNTNELGLATSYTTASTPTGNTLVFDGTLVTNSSFTWSTNRAAQALRLVDPANAVTLTLSGATYDLGGTSGVATPIDLSSATKDFTLTSTSSNAIMRVRGTGGVATISVAGGATLGVQVNLRINNPSAGTNTLRMTGAGNFTVNGTNGKITDKDLTNLTAFKHDGTGTVTFSNANTYTGGTTLNSGTLVAENAGALGGGAVTVSGGALDLNGAGALTLSLASGKNFTMSAGTLSFNLGTSSDQIASAGSAGFTLSGGTLALTLGSGFDYNNDYQLFSGFSSGLSSVSGLTISGYDTVNYTASLSTAGLLEFTATSIPEPSTYAVIVGGFVLAGCVARRRR